MNALMRNLICLLSCLLLFSACTSHKVELEVKPMHITIDVNIKVDKALDDFFSDIDEQDKTMKEDKK